MSLGVGNFKEVEIHNSARDFPLTVTNSLYEIIKNHIQKLHSEHLQNDPKIALMDKTVVVDPKKFLVWISIFKSSADNTGDDKNTMMSNLNNISKCCEYLSLMTPEKFDGLSDENKKAIETKKVRNIKKCIGPCNKNSLEEIIDEVAIQKLKDSKMKSTFNAISKIFDNYNEKIFEGLSEEESNCLKKMESSIVTHFDEKNTPNKKNKRGKIKNKDMFSLYSLWLLIKNVPGNSSHRNFKSDVQFAIKDVLDPNSKNSAVLTTATARERRKNLNKEKTEIKKQKIPEGKQEEDVSDVEQQNRKKPKIADYESESPLRVSQAILTLSTLVIQEEKVKTQSFNWAFATNDGLKITIHKSRELQDEFEHSDVEPMKEHEGLAYPKTDDKNIANLVKDYSENYPPIPQVLIEGVLLYEQEMGKFGIPSNFHIADVPGMGQGVFVKPDSGRIKEGSFLGFYSGEYELRKLPDESDTTFLYDLVEIKVDAKLRQQLNLEKGAKYGLVIDAKKTGNYTRCFNHSSTDTNAMPYIYNKDGKIVVGLIATKPIEPGQQILWNYGDNYWDHIKTENGEKIELKHVTPDTYRLVKNNETFNIVANA